VAVEVVTVVLVVVLVVVLHQVLLGQLILEAVAVVMVTEETLVLVALEL
jgi:hypothetical protein